MKKNPLISVIIPVYKVEEYLSRCVKSVISQTYKNLEIILVDDGSPDKCPELCDNLSTEDERIKVIHKQNGGVSSARNEGLKIAKGEYVAFVDSDDWIDEKMYETMLANLQENDADLTFCRVKEVYDDEKQNKIHEQNLYFLEIKDVKHMFVIARKGNEFVGTFGFPCRMLVKSEYAKQCEFTTKLKHGEDLFYVLDLIEKVKKIVITNKYYYNYYFNMKSVTKTINENYFKNIRDLYIYSSNYLREKHLEYQYLIEHAYLYRNVINRASQKDFVKVMQQLCKEDEVLKNCFKKENYKLVQKFELGFKQKVRNFLMYHKMWRIFKILANKK